MYSELKFKSRTYRMFRGRRPVVIQEESFLNKCSIKGMGLVLGVKCRPSRFAIYHPIPNINLSLVIEITGPNESFVSRSIHFKQTFSSFEDVDHKFKSNEKDQFIQLMVMKAASRKLGTIEKLEIPFFCERFADYMLLTYIAFFDGMYAVFSRLNRTDSNFETRSSHNQHNMEWTARV